MSSSASSSAFLPPPRQSRPHRASTASGTSRPSLKDLDVQQHDGMGIPQGGIVMQGYLLKKKRKKMQGMARRYFRLDITGALSYSFDPDSPVRDSLSVPISYISARRKQRTLDIDGGNTVYHCKALSVGDFEQWASALQRFTRKNDGSNTPAAIGNVALPNVGADVDIEKIAQQADSLNEPIRELESILQELRSTNASPQFSPKLSSSPGNTSSFLSPDARVPSTASSSSGSNGANTGSSMFRFLGKRSNSQSGPSPRDSLAVSPSISSTGSNGQPIPSPRSSSFSSSSPRSPSFSSTNPSQVSADSSTATTPTGGDERFFDAPAAPSVNALLIQRFSSTLELLKSTHASLVESLENLPPSRSFVTSPGAGGNVEGFNPAFSFGSPRSSSPSSPSIPPPSSHYASRSASIVASNSPSMSQYSPYYTANHRQTPSRASSSRASFSSFFSAEEGSRGEWGDDGASMVEGEFVLEEDEEPKKRTGSDSDDEEGETTVRRDEEEEEEDDEDDEDDDDDDATSEERKRKVGAERRKSTIAEEPEDEEGTFDEGEATDEEVLEEQKLASGAAGGRKRSQTQGSNYDQKAKRRTQLPAQCGAEESMVSLAKSMIGKDMSNMSLPVTTNEPISALQRIAEELEYSELLDRASTSSDPVDRIMLVAVYAISTYGGNKYRCTRKPFNPLIGETYECIRPDKGFKFVSEKVSHQPLVFAFHADTKLDDNSDRGWEMDGDLSTTTTMWGRSMEIQVKGTNCIKLTKHGEEYEIKRPSSFVRNMILGTPYLEIAGDLTVKCASTGCESVVNFKEGSAWGGSSTRNKVAGKVMDSSGKTVRELVGQWDESVDRKMGKNNFERLWQIGDFPPNPQQYYGFSRFALELNERTPLDEGHAPTDSRLRPDQLALERGDIGEAERIKKEVESKQREKRKQGTLPTPQWFKQDGSTWSYNGRYFETRDKQAFEDPDLF